MGRFAARLVAGLGMLLCAMGTHASEVARFTPQGVVERVQGVQVEFSTPAIALGDDLAPDPYVIHCGDDPAAGSGRWVDERHWTYTFPRPLAAGVSCRATVNPGFRDPDGMPLPERAYSFHTGGPRPTVRRPWGSQIAEDQVFVLSFNGGVDTASLVSKARCRVQGLGEAVAVRPITGEIRRSILEATGLSDSIDDPAFQLLQCKRTLPPAAKVRLEIAAGIRTVAAGGQAAVASLRRHGFDFEVREPFSARLNCSREHADADCSPLGDIVLRFSAAVPTAQAQTITLETPQGPRQPEPPEDHEADLTEALRFAGPFPERATLRLAVPAALHDDAGRTLANAAVFPLAFQTAALPPLVKFASGSFGVIERYAEAPGPGVGAPAAVPLALRRVGPELLTRELSVSAGKASDHVTLDEAQALRWYLRTRLFDSGELTAGQIADARALRPLRDEDADVPRIDLRRVSLFEGRQDVRSLTLPGVSQGPDIELVGLPLEQPGFHLIEIESPQLGASLLGESAPVYVRTAVLLTNLAVHVKTGRDDMLVWVTTLDGAEPAAGAQVTVLDCAGTRLDAGTTDADGLWHRQGRLPVREDCLADASGLFVTARLPASHPQAGGQADFSFAWSSWDRGIEPWRFPVSTSMAAQPDLVAHAVLDRSLLHAGDTLSMKLFLRAQTRHGLENPDPARLPAQAAIEHDGSGERSLVDLEWRSSPTGGVYAVAQHAVPAAARLGRYTVWLLAPRDPDQPAWMGPPDLAAGEFRVESFVLPILGGSLKLSAPGQGPALVAPAAVQADIQLAYLSGGPAGGLPVQLSAVARPRTPQFAAYPDYSFGVPEAMRTGVEDTGAEGLRRLIVDKQAIELDAKGGGRWQLDALPPVTDAQSWRFEASFMDPNGQVQTLTQSAEVWPAAVVAGLRAGGSLAQGDAASVSLLAVDAAGRPQAGVAMRLDGRVRTVYSTRKRLVGGFYRYDSHDSITELGTLCEGRSDERGVLACTVALDRWGEIQLFARATDAEGRVSEAASSVWVWGRDTWFGGGDDDRVDLIPERRSWAPGETATFQLRMPFRHARALVAVEREGVLETHVLEVDGDEPVIRVPVREDWGPNVYVSVLAVRGRIRELPWDSFLDWGWRQPLDWYRAWSRQPGDVPAPTALVDLAKPAFRFGLAEIAVDDGQGRLQVSVQADRTQYRVRDTAKVEIAVRRPDGQPAARAGVALLAVDEALLELMDNRSWDLYSAMRPERSYGVETATGLGQVVGRRHYGRKAIPAGGGGGFSPTRELFDTLLLWRGEIVLDEQGRASVEVPLNDSLTRFRIVAVADAGTAMFGTSSVDIVSTQDLQLLSGLPPLVRSGDAYTGRFTLRNRTDRAMDVSVTASVGAEALPGQTLHIEAGGAATAEWPTVAPDAGDGPGPDHLAWDIRAHEQAGDAPGARAGQPASDHLRVQQSLIPAVPVQVRQSTLLRLAAGKAVTVPVDPGAGALRNAAGAVRGSVRVDLQSSLAGRLPGVADWLARYPYTCVEQLGARALGMGDTAAWDALMATLPGYLDRDGLLAYFPGGDGSVPLTAHMLAITAQAQALGLPYGLPDAPRERMVAALQDFVLGRSEPQAWAPVRDEAWRKLIAIEALARHQAYQDGMLDSIDLDVAAWPSAALVDWLSILQQVPDIAGRSQRLVQVKSLLRSRLSRHGTTLVLDDPTADAGWWLMSTPETAQARLLLALRQEADWRDDVPRLAMGLLGLQRQGAWSTTAANAWGTLALAGFGQAFEAEPVQGRVRLSLAAGGPEQTLAWDAMPQQDGVQRQRVDLPWAAPGRDTLRLQAEGRGNGWATVSARAAVEAARPVDAGMRIERRISAVAQAREGVWQPGDVYRVHLRITAQAPTVWAVISDPVPAGAAILGSGLGRDSALATQGDEPARPWLAPSVVERDAGMYRAYFEHLPAGVRELEYTVRINAPGRYHLPPTRVEALYQPEIFGTLPNGRFDVSGP